MGRYRDDPGAIRALVEADRVHRDVYLDPEIFALEMERLWPNAWIFVGHDSQAPKPGDYYATDLGAFPVIMARHSDGAINVMMNRCAHKGTKLVSAAHGNVGRAFRCPYHGWTYRTDGALLGVPLKGGYAETRFAECAAAQGLTRIAAVENYRGFVFVRMSESGPGFAEYFGDSLSSIDNLVDRAPAGALEVAGGCLRYMHDCNWKLYVENLNDTMHPMIAHQSAAGTAKRLWADQPEDAPKPMVIEQLTPFVEGYEFFDKMGVRVFANGHSYSGVNFSIHSSYASVPAYADALIAAYGEERTKQILGTVRHNTVYYPNLTIKGAIQSIRVARPLAPDKTLLESWTFRLKGAPDALLQRTVMYNRLINSPMSVVGHDDLHCYRSIQEGLRAPGNEWVSLHRDFHGDEIGAHDLVANGTSEISMRNQFRAWASAMTSGVH
jgi:benzoate/toluate 1,2-dioxygenase alpha subunit